MVAAHFSNLFNGQPRFVEQKSLGVAHSKVDQIPGRCTVVDLAENFGQVAGTVVQVICDQIQINILAVIIYNKILKQISNLRRCQGSGLCIEYFFIIISGNLKFFFLFLSKLLSAHPDQRVSADNQKPSG